MKLASYASVTVAFILIVAKTAAWLSTGSVAILSSLVDSLLDAIASIVTLVAIRHSLQPADREHRFGHGKGGSPRGIGAVRIHRRIGGACCSRPAPVAGDRETDRKRRYRHLCYGVFDGPDLSPRLVPTMGNRQVRSVAISADLLHYQGDILMNAAVIAAILIVTELGWVFADPIFGAAIATYIIWSAYLIVRNSLDMLMDRELPDDERQKIRGIALEHEEVEAVHDLRTRQSGLTYFIQLHLEMDGDMNLLQAHEIADEVELALMEAYPGAEIIIHQDPAGVEEPPQFR